MHGLMVRRDPVMVRLGYGIYGVRYVYIKPSWLTGTSILRVFRLPINVPRGWYRLPRGNRVIGDARRLCFHAISGRVYRVKCACVNLFADARNDWTYQNVNGVFFLFLNLSHLPQVSVVTSEFHDDCIPDTRRTDRTRCNVND